MLLLKMGVGIKSILICTAIEWTIGLIMLLDAWKIAKREGKDYQLKEVNRGKIYLLFAVFATMGSVGAGFSGGLLLKDTYVAYNIPTQSMSPTLIPGDQILLKKGGYRDEEPMAGDIVVFRAPDERNHHYIKRIVGLPGQSVEIRSGKLLVDGNELSVEGGMESNGKSQYAIAERNPGLNFGPEIVPPYHVFTLGDNRANSRDSRHFGPIAINALEGKVAHRHLPLNRFGEVE